MIITTEVWRCEEDVPFFLFVDEKSDEDDVLDGYSRTDAN